MMRKTPLKKKGFLSKGKGLSSGNTTLKSNSSLNRGKSTLKQSKPINKGCSNLKSSSKMSRSSKNQKKIDVKYIEVCRDMANNTERVCTGCRQVYEDQGLTHSHLIPRSKRSDLIAVRENITYHCQGPGTNNCHSKWESVGRVDLLDYDVNMNIVKKLDGEYYELLLLKQSEYGKRRKEDD